MILDIMRKQKRLFAWVLLPLLVVGLVAYLIPGVGGVWGQGITSPSLARVGQAEISVRDFNATFQRFLRSNRMSYDRKFLKMLRIEQQILNQLISKEVVVYHSRRLGMDATPQEIQEKILAVPVFLEDGNFLLTRYKAVLRQNGLTVEEFEEGIRYEIVQEKLRQLVTEYVNVSDVESEEDYRIRNEKVKVSYVVFDPSSFEKSVVVSEEESKAHYEQNKETYRLPEQRKVDYLLANITSLESQFEPSKGDMKNYYEKNQADFQVQEQVKASHILFKTADKSPTEVEKIKNQAETILKQAKGGKDFSDLAMKHSEDGSASNGGDLGFFGRGRMVAEFERIAFSLKVGQISDLVSTQFGFHIIKVFEKQKARIQDFKEVEATISSSLTSQKAEVAARDLIDKAYRQTKKDMPFQAVAKELNLSFQSSPFISPGAPFPGIGNAPELSTKVFSMTKGEISQPIQVPNGFVLVKLTEAKSSTIPIFSEVRQEVEGAIKNEKSDALAKVTAQDLKGKIKPGRSLKSVARRTGLKAKLSEAFTRNGTIQNLGASTPLDNFAFFSEIGEVSDPVKLGKQFVVAQLKEKMAIDLEAFIKEKKEIQDRLRTQKRETVFQAFLEHAKTQMEEIGEIWINQARLAELAAKI